MTDLELVERLGTLAAGQAVMQERVQQHHEAVSGQLTDLRADVRSIEKTLSGNGHPEEGIAHRILGVETKIASAMRVAGWSASVLAVILSAFLLSRIEACERLAAVAVPRIVGTP